MGPTLTQSLALLWVLPPLGDGNVSIRPSASFWLAYGSQNPPLWVLPPLGVPTMLQEFPLSEPSLGHTPTWSTSTNLRAPSSNPRADGLLPGPSRIILLLCILPPLRINMSNLSMGRIPTSGPYQVHNSADGGKTPTRKHSWTQLCCWDSPHLETQPCYWDSPHSEV